MEKTSTVIVRVPTKSEAEAEGLLHILTDALPDMGDLTEDFYQTSGLIEEDGALLVSFIGNVEPEQLRGSVEAFMADFLRSVKDEEMENQNLASLEEAGVLDDVRLEEFPDTFEVVEARYYAA